MLTRLEVDGFKSLEGFAVDLEPFTVFIGPNGAGKSNILEALALLSRLASMPIVDAFKAGRGRPLDQFSRHGDESAREIRFAVEFLSFGKCSRDGTWQTNDVGRLRYELVIERLTRASGTEQLTVRRELVRNLGRDEDAWLSTHPDFIPLVQTHDKIIHGFIAERGQVTWLPEVFPEENQIEIDPRRTLLAREAVRIDVDKVVRENLRSCQWIRLDLPHLAGPSDRVDTGGLLPDGSNLPTVLADLAPEQLGDIRTDLVALVPGLASFFVVPEGDALRIEFELSGGERLPAHLASDGTLRLLALLTALHTNPRPNLIGIEEPENGIYPGRLLALVEVLQREASLRLFEQPAWVSALFEGKGGTSMETNLLPPQILLTTHSPLILSALRKQVKHLRFIDTVHRDHRRVTRARTVGTPSRNQRHATVSRREIDQLLNTVTGGDFT